jgi:acetoacetate decarboxylase
MAKKGRLTRSQYGATMPVTCPAVQSPPFYYRNAEMIIVSYRTSEEAALRLLPEGVELADPPTASVMVARYHFTTFGPYNEASLGIACNWQGGRRTYTANLFVDQEAPLIAGREIWGYPKKLAQIELVQEREQFMGTVERPTQNRLLTAVMRCVRNVPEAEWESPPVLSLKVIPSAESDEPAIAQLVECEFRLTPIVGTDGLSEVWSGPGSLTFNSPTSTDPWHELPVEEVSSCVYGRFNAYLPYGKVLAEY